ncbi:hypothetical protein GCM10018965_004140 [Nonomuraea roseola]
MAPEPPGTHLRKGSDEGVARGWVGETRLIRPPRGRMGGLAVAPHLLRLEDHLRPNLADGARPHSSNCTAL